MVAVGVDVGGTNVLAAAVDGDGAVTAEVKVTTPTGGPGSVVAAVAAAVAGLGVTPSVVGVGVPGPVHGDVLVTAPNLAGFDQPVALAADLRAALGVPVVLGNDADVGTLGEVTGGAARGGRAVLGVWLGTGVGGGLVLDGRLHRGAFGGAGELGHMIVRQGGRRCGCGRQGCVEAYAGRAGMEAAVADAIAAGADTALEELRRARGKGRYTSGIWAKALDRGDPTATAVLDEAVSALGAALGSAINLVDLDLLVFGGGLTEKLGQPFVDRVAAATRPWVLADTVERRFVAAALGDHSGVVGAAALARAQVG